MSESEEFVQAPLLLMAENMPPEARELFEKLSDACAGFMLSDVATAVFLLYTDTLVRGCADWAMYRKNLEAITITLEANGRNFFNVKGN